LDNSPDESGPLFRSARRTYNTLESLTRLPTTSPCVSSICSIHIHRDFSSDRRSFPLIRIRFPPEARLDPTHHTKCSGKDLPGARLQLFEMARPSRLQGH